MDGVLICVFGYRGEIIVHTRGSWGNEFIDEAITLFEDKYPEYWHNLLDDPHEYNEDGHGYGIDYGRTDCFELISPVSRIVVDYIGRRGLSWLQSFWIYNQSGELNGAALHPLRDMSNHLYLCDADEVAGWTLSEHTPNLTLDSFTSKASNDQEGYVIYLPWCNEYYKFKFADYKAKHRAVFNTSDMSVWDTWRYGDNIAQDLIDCTAKIDIKLSGWISEQVGWLSLRRANLLNEANYVYKKCILNGESARADFARRVLAEAKRRTPCIKSMVFALYDGKEQEAESIAAKALKPDKTAFYRQEDITA
jgi:hypothetical protein